MPPAFRNHLVPTGCDTPASNAASWLLKPAAIPNQNRLCSSRPATGGRPGDGNGARPDRSDRRFRMLIATSNSGVLRRPFESALAAPVAMVHEAAAMDRPSIMQCLLQRVEHEAGVRRARDPPAHDPAGIGVDHKGDVDKAGPGREWSKKRERASPGRRRQSPTSGSHRT